MKKIIIIAAFVIFSSLFCMDDKKDETRPRSGSMNLKTCDKTSLTLVAGVISGYDSNDESLTPRSKKRKNKITKAVSKTLSKMRSSTDEKDKDQIKKLDSNPHLLKKISKQQSKDLDKKSTTNNSNEKSLKKSNSDELRMKKKSSRTKHRDRGKTK